jgi:vacuolar-type H+-ATPase subunit F/Vma7
MMPIRQVSIAVIGDEDLANAMRLAGVSKCYVIDNSQNSREETRNALSELLADSEIGIIAIQEEYMEQVDDLVRLHMQDKRMIPVIIGLPSKRGTRYPDVAGYYKTYIKGIIGFDIEI